MNSYKSCGCDQHWLLADLTETELALAFGSVQIIKRNGKRFVANSVRHPRIGKIQECCCMECPNISEHILG